MRRQGQHYHQGGNAYGDQTRHVSSQRMEYTKSSGGNYQRREQGLGNERGRDYGHARDEEQWRSERDGSNITNPHMINEVHHDGLEKPIYNDHRSGFQSGFGDDRHPSYQTRQEVDIPCADDSMSLDFESIENKFLGEIMNLVKEQKDTEDAEYARHKEKLDTINIQYQEQLTTLRENQASRREILLQNESNARQQQYQQAMADQYSHHSMPANNPHSYHEPSTASDASRYAHRQQRNPTSISNNKINKDSYNYSQRDHFSSGLEDHRHHRAEPQNRYNSGRVYDNNRGGFY